MSIICQNCKIELPDGSAFCNKCGNKIELKNLCPSCKSELPDGSAFCNKCGAITNQIATTPQLPVQNNYTQNKTAEPAIKDKVNIEEVLTRYDFDYYVMPILSRYTIECNVNVQLYNNKIEISENGRTKTLGGRNDTFNSINYSDIRSVQATYKPSIWFLIMLILAIIFTVIFSTQYIGAIIPLLFVNLLAIIYFTRLSHHQVSIFTTKGVFYINGKDKFDIYNLARELQEKQYTR